MQKKYSRKLLSFILCMVLMVAIALFTGGCGDKTGSGEPVPGGADPSAAKQTASSDTEQTAEARTDLDEESGVRQLGEGETQFLFTVVDKDGNETQFEIHTDKETVGEALEELELIAGEESEYGLYVKTVNGITADYDTDGVYWAFYVNDEYAQTGVDATAITAGDAYAFKAEK